MHQDAEGQMNFWFILSDQQKPSGVTAFFKSHLLNRSASKSRLVSNLHIKIF